MNTLYIPKRMYHHLDGDVNNIMRLREHTRIHGCKSAQINIFKQKDMLLVDTFGCMGLTCTECIFVNCTNTPINSGSEPLDNIELYEGPL
jgi:hypothetical protein